MSAMETDAAKVLNFIVARNKGAEDAPVKLGNVAFWHPVPGFGAGLCYSIPVARWNVQAVQDDLNRLAGECWTELCEHLGAGKEVVS